MFDESFSRWKYWQPWPTWRGSRSYVLCKSGGIVAHGAVMPLQLDVDGAERTLLHPFDWAAEPSALGAGALLLQRLLRLADGMLIMGGSEMTQRMAGPLGFRRDEDVLRHAAPPSPSPPGSSTLEMRAVPSRDWAPPIDRAPSPGPAVLRAHRSPAFLDVLRLCPVVAIDCFLVLVGGAPLGGFAWALAPGQVRILDSWCRSPEAGAWSRVLAGARRLAHERAPTCEVVCLANTPVEREALAGAGFVACGGLPVFCRTTPRGLLEGSRLRLQMIDGDAAFLHHGAPESWLSQHA